VPQELVDGTHLPRGTLLLGRYVVGAFVEANGVIALHDGHDSETFRPVHISVVPLPTGAALADVGRVQRAAKELERLDHPGVAKVLATGMTERGDLAVIEEWIDAPTLAEVVRLGPIGVERTITLGLSLVAGLEAAHTAALAHHDLAPTRVRVRPDGTGVMTGLGQGDLLRALDPLAELRPTSGTAARYRAPEQAHDRLVTRHADLYSLGAVLFEALTGTPYTGPGDALASGPSGTDSSMWGGAALERPIAEVLTRCLERKPWNRCDSAARVREALEAARAALQQPDAAPGVDLAAIAWSPPTSEPQTRPRPRPTSSGDSGLLAAVPVRERDPFEQDARPSDEAPIAPIARPVVRHLPERFGSWWLVAALVGLIATGLAMTRLRSAGSASPTTSGTPEREVSLTSGVMRASAEVEAARREAQVQRVAEAEALAHQEADEQQLLEAEELARVELEQTARRGAMERAGREAAALAQLELEERLWLEGEELARMDAEEATRSAEERARSEAEEATRRAQESARIAAEEAARKADARMRREADARIRRQLESTRAIAAPLPAGSPARGTDPDRHAPAPAAPRGIEPTQPDGTAPSIHRALLVTVPEGASVLVDGAPIGKTPLTLSWASGTESSVWVMLEGHEPANLVISDRQHTKMLRLELVESHARH